ncbi:GTPase-associated system all-helical protein GASH [Rhizobium leguminosarum]|uniref:GTPase-associated system all-helical protein GASH n=1 Tax=Rhizobium leguminosarum TaxID=384 RepID=UPI001C94A3DD|nr:GTPase-associated system all-helical protein GASH [Rhizobium leguminosarum]MBY5694679.1 hypothetical protein [Rhizobium leguminosarum]
MASSPNGFNFSEAYRKMQPTAERSIITARETAHKTILADAMKSAAKVVDLARLAFGLPVAPERELDDWFGKAVKKGDKHFSLQIDTEEAARIATLLLSDAIHSGYYNISALVIAASFSGKRLCPDDSKIVELARAALADAPRKRGMSFTANLTLPQSQDISKFTTAVAASLDGSTVKAALDAVHSDARSLSTKLVANINQTLQTLTNENRRLAEEVDLLWWHMGGQSFLLGVPVVQVQETALPLLIGADVAAMVTVLPGPHGAYGIIRRALGATADKDQSIADTVLALPAEHRRPFLGEKVFQADDVAVLHYAVKMVSDDDGDQLGPGFEKTTGLKPQTKLTRYQIALQAYHERLFIKHGWL